MKVKVLVYRGMHAWGVMSTLALVCPPHLHGVQCTLEPSVNTTPNPIVCYAHQKKCAYRNRGSTPYLVCAPHQTFYSVVSYTHTKTPTHTHTHTHKQHCQAHTQIPKEPKHVHHLMMTILWIRDQVLRQLCLEKLRNNPSKVYCQ